MHQTVNSWGRDIHPSCLAKRVGKGKEERAMLISAPPTEGSLRVGTKVPLGDFSVTSKHWHKGGYGWGGTL